jgi:hypothetical protein
VYALCAHIQNGVPHEVTAALTGLPMRPLALHANQQWLVLATGACHAACSTTSAGFS